MPTHKWHLEVTDSARSQIRKLPSKDRMAVFGSIRELLEADNPKQVPGVRKLVGKEFGDQWRHRQGDYRIFFTVIGDAIVISKFTYKGTVTIQAVLHRSKAYEP